MLLFPVPLLAGVVLGTDGRLLWLLCCDAGARDDARAGAENLPLDSLGRLELRQSPDVRELSLVRVEDSSLDEPFLSSTIR